MKGCFLMQRGFVYVGHHLAKLLVEFDSSNSFCGYIQVRSGYDFLKNQTDLNYSGLLLDEDVHKEYESEKLDLEFLAKLEKEYGIPNLWPYLAVDRIIMFNQLVREYPHNTPKYSHDEMLKILQVKAKAVIKFLDEQKPDYILSTWIGSTATMLFYHIAKKRGIKTLVLNLPSIPNTITLSTDYTTFSWVDKIFKDNLSKTPIIDGWYSEADKYVHSFRNRPRVYSKVHDKKNLSLGRAKQLSFLLPHNLLRSIHWLITMFYRHFTSGEKNDYSYISPSDYLIDHTRRKIRNAIGLSDLYDKYEKDAPYAFFGLHLEPEASLLLLAPFNTDQINIIRNCAKSLPVGYLLYVKEHPHMVPYRPRSYYKELKKIPNVRIIDPNVSSFELIHNAKLVMTVTGSVGWEATVLGKPVVTFGKVFYNSISFVKECTDFEKLPHIIKKQLEDFNYSYHELITYIAAVMEDSAHLDLLYLWEQEKDEAKKRHGLIPLAKYIEKKLLN